MAGLYTNIVTSKNRSMPLFPESDRSVDVYGGFGNSKTFHTFLPGFSGGTAGDSVTIPFRAGGYQLFQYDANLTASTDGVWASGITVDEASGSAATDDWLQWYMDEADNKLYMLTEDTGTNPRTLYLSSVNEAGTVTAIGNAQLGNQSMAASSIWGTIAGPMHRTGGDGSGNLQFPCFYTAGGNAAAGVPYRGCMVTINISDGSLSYANLFPSTYSSETYPTTSVCFGPTDNNILMTQNYAWSQLYPTNGVKGGIFNLTTGKSAGLIIIDPKDGTIPYGTSTPYGIRWRGRYAFGNYEFTYGKAPNLYAEADIHNWVDQMAVYYGIL